MIVNVKIKFRSIINAIFNELFIDEDITKYNILCSDLMIKYEKSLW